MKHFVADVNEEFIHYWINTTREYYKTLKESRSLYVMQDAMRNLIFRLAMFRPSVFVPAKDRAVEKMRNEEIT
ncbi:unnamed protein product, partial [marine sediment metagenome]